MATVIPALGSCAARMTSGERRLAERLEQKLEDDYLLWYDVPIGPKQTHPDFVVLHPRRGALILETKGAGLYNRVRTETAPARIRGFDMKIRLRREQRASFPQAICTSPSNGHLRSLNPVRH